MKHHTTWNDKGRHGTYVRAFKHRNLLSLYFQSTSSLLQVHKSIRGRREEDSYHEMVPPVHRGAHCSRIPMSLPLFHAVVCAVPAILRRMVPEEEERERETTVGHNITVRRMVITMEDIAKGDMT